VPVTFTLERMEHLAGLVMDVALTWWRVTASIAAALLLAWSIDTYTSVHSVVVTYSLMMIALVCGVVWHRQCMAAGRDEQTSSRAE
jgi:hypothetical protein